MAAISTRDFVEYPAMRLKFDWYLPQEPSPAPRPHRDWLQQRCEDEYLRLHALPCPPDGPTPNVRLLRTATRPRPNRPSRFPFMGTSALNPGA